MPARVVPIRLLVTPRVSTFPRWAGVCSLSRAKLLTMLNSKAKRANSRPIMAESNPTFKTGNSK